jgi:hypothetical protein
MNKFNTISLVFKIYRQNRFQFANLLANLVQNFITNFDNLMRNFRIWLAGFQSTWWSRVHSSQIPNQSRNWRGQSFVKSTVIDWIYQRDTICRVFPLCTISSLWWYLLHLSYRFRAFWLASWLINLTHYLPAASK